MGRETSAGLKAGDYSPNLGRKQESGNGSQHLISQSQSLVPPAEGAEGKEKQQCWRQNPHEKTSAGCATLRSKPSPGDDRATSGAQDLRRSGRVPTAKQEQQIPPQGTCLHKVNRHKGCSRLTWQHRSPAIFSVHSSNKIQS